MKRKASSQVPFQLDQRGILWQVIGFAIIGIVTTSTLAIYSGADTVPFRFLDIATSKLNWGFVPAIAFLIEGTRDMFRTNAEIREAARKKVRDQGRREEKERIRSELKARGVEIPPEIAKDVFEDETDENS